MVKGLLVAGLAMATPVAAQTAGTGDAPLAPYADVGGWSVTRQTGTCLAIGNFGNADGSQPSQLSLTLNARSRQVLVTFSDTSIKSLARGDVRKIGILFGNGNRPDDGWGEREFTVNISGEWTIFGKWFPEEFLNDFASNTNLGFWYKSAILQSYKLNQTSKVVASLRACAKDEALHRPIDPFAE